MLAFGSELLLVGEHERAALALGDGESKEAFLDRARGAVLALA